MKILIIDRDDAAAQIMASKLKDMGHSTVIEPIKNEGVERVTNDQFDLVLVDPSPMNDAKAMVLNLKRASKSPLDIILLVKDVEDVNYDDVLSVGCNDFVKKPVDIQSFERKISNTHCLRQYAAKLADMREDFPSAGGVIAKSAFNQLFLTALDRGGRYKERTYILTIGIDNFEEIVDLDGSYNAEYSASKMAQLLTKVRRLSDVIGQIGINEYALLIQRTQEEAEAVDAAKRFAAVIDDAKDLVPDGGHPVVFSVRLLHLPSGKEPFKHFIEKKAGL